MIRVPFLVVIVTTFIIIWTTYVIYKWRFFPPLFRYNDSKAPWLRLNSENEFHISILSDLHYGEEEHGWGIDQDIKSDRVIRKILHYENPDLVILNGDLITGENTFLHNSTKYLDVIVKPMVDHGIPWASTYGNHDSQFNLSREALFQEEKSYKLSYTRHSPPNAPGITNYFIPVYPHGAKDKDKPLVILWFFDSQGGGLFQGIENPTPNWVEPETVKWFQSEHREIQTRWGYLPSLVFVHIPPTAFLQVQEKQFPQAGHKSTRFPGLNDDVPLAIQGDGWQDIPFMKAIVDIPNVHSIYSGHDHGDSWCANWPESENVTQGIGKPHLCFCKHTGYGGYGRWNRGSRVLKLHFGMGGSGEMDVETWVRMEDGRVIQKVGLNSTYGFDRYPTDNGED